MQVILNIPIIVGYLKHTDYLKAIGANIKKERESKGISQHELSFRIDISRNQIGRIERGEINTSLSALYEISTGLNVDVKELVDIEFKK